jgi:hypothetical protein
VKNSTEWFTARSPASEMVRGKQSRQHRRAALKRAYEALDQPAEQLASCRDEVRDPGTNSAALCVGPEQLIA